MFTYFLKLMVVNDSFFAVFQQIFVPCDPLVLAYVVWEIAVRPEVWVSHLCQWFVVVSRELFAVQLWLYVVLEENFHRPLHGPRFTVPSDPFHFCDKMDLFRAQFAWNVLVDFIRGTSSLFYFIFAKKNDVFTPVAMYLNCWYLFRR